MRRLLALGLLAYIAACSPTTRRSKGAGAAPGNSDPVALSALPFRLSVAPDEGATTQTAARRWIWSAPLERGLVAVTWWNRSGSAPVTVAEIDQAAQTLLGRPGFSATAPRDVGIAGASAARRVDFTFAGDQSLVGALVLAVREPVAFDVLVAAEPGSPAAQQLEQVLGSFEIVAGVPPWT
ncbi:MAG TPA: hypothetical protein VIK91_17200 [Nannocystis sp.]